MRNFNYAFMPIFVITVMMQMLVAAPAFASKVPLMFKQDANIHRFIRDLIVQDLYSKPQYKGKIKAYKRAQIVLNQKLHTQHKVKTK